MDDAIVRIVTPTLVLGFEVGTAGGFRRLGGGAGAALRCDGTGELGIEDINGAEWGTGGEGESGERGISCAAGENGDWTTIVGGSCVRTRVSSKIVGRLSCCDVLGVSTSMDPALSRRRTDAVLAIAAATFGRLIELMLLPDRNASPKARSLCSALPCIDFTDFKCSALRLWCKLFDLLPDDSVGNDAVCKAMLPLACIDDDADETDCTS